MKIRLLQRADYSAVREIYKAVRNEYLQYQTKGSGEVYDPVSLDLDVAQLDFYTATHSSFVAESNGKLLGVLLAQPLQWVNEFNRLLWLEYIAVDASNRRSGVGLALISTAKQFAQEHGIRSLFTTLNIDNEESKSLLLTARFDVRDWRIASFPAHDRSGSVRDSPGKQLRGGKPQ